MRTLALFLLLCGVGCRQPLPSPTPAGPQGLKPAEAQVPTPAPSPAWTSTQEACIERYLEAHGLDGFGSPRGSMYPGGTPLFDEASGQRLSRDEYLARRHPEILHACGL
jgi:hypothetical protein